MKCMFCDKDALDGHLTCGEVTCPESTAREIKRAQWIKEQFRIVAEEKAK